MLHPPQCCLPPSAAVYPALLLAMLPTLGIAQPVEAESTRFYRSPEERREAGLGRQLTDWLAISGLLESEKMLSYNDVDMGRQRHDNSPLVSTLQLGVNLTVAPWLEAELIFEGEQDRRYHSQLDEAVITMEVGRWGVSAGRLYPPFGEYYSHFVTGPMLEFGESRDEAIVVDFSPLANLELAAFVFDGRARRIDSSDELDWGYAVELSSADEALRFGASYLSDLAESEEALLEDERHRYQRRVSAWSAYALLGFRQLEITAELLRATAAFAEKDQTADKPSAYNLELAYFPRPGWQLALRYEHSSELEDQPKRRSGLSLTWLPLPYLGLSLDYLYGEYQRGFVSDDDERELRSQQQLVGLISLEF